MCPLFGTAVGGEGAADDRVMLAECLGVDVGAQAREQGGGALDVGEEKSERLDGQKRRRTEFDTS